MRSLFDKMPFVKQIIKYMLVTSFVEFFKRIFANLNLTKTEKDFIKHNQKKWSQEASINKKRVIIFDVFDVPEMHITYSYMLNLLAKKFGAVSKNYIWEYSRIPGKTQIIYQSYNVRETIRILLNSEQKKKVQDLLRQYKPLLKTKEDVLNLTIDGHHLGVDIYESYLRELNKHTLFFDQDFERILNMAFSIYVFWLDYFDQHEVVAHVVSHEAYIWMNIASKIAYKRGIPVYMPNSRSITYATEPFSIYSFFPHYQEIFKRLSEQEQKEGIEIAKKQLQRRVGGEVGVNIHHADVSAYGNSKETKRVLKDTDKTKVLVATHCFYDNPHCYNLIPFVDFYEWLKFLGEFSKETDYEWYIKVHPDPQPGTLEIIQEILNEYPQFILLDHSTSHHQIISEGIDAVLSVYGTIGEEYPYFDIPVINSGYNPRLGYDFNYHALDHESYKKVLREIPQMKFKANKDKLYEFYYTHHYLNWVDDLIFNSYNDLLSKLSGNDYLTDKVYDYYLNEFSEETHNRTYTKLENFVDSKHRSLFSFGAITYKN